jgi:hypothetical protein
MGLDFFKGKYHHELRANMDFALACAGKLKLSPPFLVFF